MDPLSDMLAGLRASRTEADRIRLEPSRPVRFDGGAALTMLALVEGEGASVSVDGTERKMSSADTALVRGPEPFTVTGDGAVAVGAYHGSAARQERLLRTLPPVLVLEEEAEEILWLQSLSDALERRRQPGGQALLDRVLDWGLVCTLSCWFDQQGAEAPSWYRGVTDPVVGPALEAIHRRPSEAWTVGSLAAEASVSRAHFAKRFAEVMGQPPMDYLTEWRMCLAEDLLVDSDHSVAAVAKSVGYADPFAFSTAFKRRQGTSPRDFRARTRGPLPS